MHLAGVAIPIDVFISYRRSLSTEEASQLEDGLARRGISVFRDVELEGGLFPPQLENAIASARNFLLVLRANTLDDCDTPRDWIRREVECAFEAGCRIVPLLIRTDGETLADLTPSKLVPAIARIGEFQGVTVNRSDLFGNKIAKRAALDSIIAKLDLNPPVGTQIYISASEADGAHVEALARTLAEAGLSAWPSSAADCWTSNCALRVMTGAAAVVVLQSREAQRSDRVDRDRANLVNAGRPALVVPVVDDLPLPSRFVITSEPMNVPSWKEALIQRLHALGCFPRLSPISPSTEGVRNQTSPQTADQPNNHTPEAAANPAPRDRFDALFGLATITDRIWVVPAGSHVPTSGTRDLGERPGALRRFKLGEHLRVVIDVDQEGHLLLLDAGPTGSVYCLCPSTFARDTRLKVGAAVLPHDSAEIPYFELGGVPGNERLLAIVSTRPPSFDWSPSVDTPARVLDQDDIQQLLEWLDSEEGSWRSFGTAFEVTGRDPSPSRGGRSAAP